MSTYKRHDNPFRGTTSQDIRNQRIDITNPYAQAGSPSVNRVKGYGSTPEASNYRNRIESGCPKSA
ncbi:hypothetical protein F511_04349 [Dorcoceras hygrometricum]|uniref:Uncharacterized protein n=1 Tax=Dorcoceras hygrometricum TaxID=472368 RepID=A0A2Z7BL46_9LAMI|nr:hypothetical protein F511_04349 [Dorcoceras hygrometricum]